MNRDFCQCTRKCFTKNGDKVLHICAEFGKVDIFKFFAHDISPLVNAKIDAQNSAEETPLMIACREGKLNIVKMFCEDYDPNNDFDIN